MKNKLSIRAKILTGVVVVNLLGIMVAMVYLHESYSAGVDADAARAVAVSKAAFEQLQDADTTLDPVKDHAAVADVLIKMNAISGAQYTFMLDKSATDQQTYTAARQAANLGDAWDTSDTYALLFATDEATAEKIDFGVPAGNVPDMGRIVGVENGACSEMCHEAITAEGDYWGVAWSTDRRSRAHSVFPVDGPSGPVGVVYAIHDISAQADEARISMNRTFIVVAITLLVATIMIGYMIDAWVFHRMNAMMAAIEDVSMRVAGGDLDAKFEADQSNDEIARFEQFFANVLDVMTGTIKSLVEKR
jgi:HAMP domain-containing protein